MLNVLLSMNTIPLTQGYEATVDDNYYDFLSKFTWHISAQGYAKTAISYKIKGKLCQQHIPMHHFIIGKPLGKYVVDHINRNKIDNRRDNLRVVAPMVNVRNSRSYEERCTRLGIAP